MRAATSSGRVRAAAHMSEPTMKMTIAQKNARRVPKRSAIQPEAGMSIAIVSA
jgi:hypothetical protein